MTLNDQTYAIIVDNVSHDFETLSYQEILDIYGAPFDLTKEELFDFCVAQEIENFYK